jgi:uncharacterized protein (TIGR02145 family)
VIWQDKANVGLIEFCQADGTVITTGKYEGTGGVSYFYFRPNNRQARGNVLIGIKKKGATEYLWSWHVWLTGYAPDAAPPAWQKDIYSYGVPGGAVHRYSGATWSTNYTDKFIMDRNFGAASADREQGVDSTRGLYYQFGRKDPFPAPFVKLYNVSGTAVTAFTAIANDCIVRVTGATSIKAAVQYPYNFYVPESGDWLQNNPYYTRLWNSPEWYTSVPKAGKSLFDPCPPGWRLPVNGTWNTFALAGTNTPNAANNSAVNPDATSDYYYHQSSGNEQKTGWEFYMSASSGETAFYPAPGYRDISSSALTLNRFVGYYWSASQNNRANAFCLYFYSSGAIPQHGNNSRSYGYPVRCVQE